MLLEPSNTLILLHIIVISTFQLNLYQLLQVDVERRLDAFRQSVEHTNEKLTELTGVYDDVQVKRPNLENVHHNLKKPGIKY